MREELEEVLGKLPPPVRVVFSNQRFLYIRYDKVDDNFADIDDDLDDYLGD